MKKRPDIGYEMHRLDNAVKRRINGTLREEGIDEATAMNGWILKYLYDNRDGVIYQKDIEKHFNIGRSTVTGIIKIMEQHELIARVSVEQDARLKKVILLEKGEEAHRMIKATIDDTERCMIQGITEEELDIFYGLLDKMRANIGDR